DKIKCIIPTHTAVCAASVCTLDGTTVAVGNTDSQISIVKMTPNYPESSDKMPVVSNRVGGRIIAVNKNELLPALINNCNILLYFLFILHLLACMASIQPDISIRNGYWRS